ncbi:protein-L-isoaspartate(D-aspartate) O-methyltransferase [Patescibacteria group bacterium]|nr:protein-L-isoaspartate(D-aspartate) O-methyltransferase [Patescibacteria group bacterium]
MQNNESLINLLINQGYLQSPEIIQAFKKVDRLDFIKPEMFNEAYENHPLPIGNGQTISQPATVALMLELLQVKKGDKVLDVGSGSGWQIALLAELAGKRGKVIGLEVKDELIEFAKENLLKYQYQNIKIIKGDGWQGLSKQAPFDKIIVAAAANEIPLALKIQLKVGGRLVIPVGGGIQDIVVIDKLSQNKFQQQNFPGFVFVPLIKD